MKISMQLKQECFTKGPGLGSFGAGGGAIDAGTVDDPSSEVQIRAVVGVE